MHRLRDQGGWTLIELLIVVAIIGILALGYILMNWKGSFYRANDARRKTDVASIRRAFEEYYNDHECYPAADILKTCGGTGLAPYLAQIPCDPVTHTWYLYQSDAGGICSGNRVCAGLQYLVDPDIITLGCSPINGCGWGPSWNYCLAAGTTVTALNFVPDVPPTPTVVPTWSPSGPHYACVPSLLPEGEGCNDYDIPANHGCPSLMVWSDYCHTGLCATPANRCTD